MSRTVLIARSPRDLGRMLSPATATKSPSILYAQGVLAIICLGLEVLDESRRLPAIWMRTLRNGRLGSVYYDHVTENLLRRKFDVVDYNRKPLDRKSVV